MNWSYRLGWICFRTLFATYLPCRFYNRERIPAHGPVILASNHASFIDPPLVGAGFNRMVNYLARDTLFDVPILAALLRSWKVVPVDRDGGGGAGLKAILDRLLNGGIILLFPEGTRTRDGQLQPGKAGVGLAVIKSNAPVVPVRVFGTFEAYGRHLKFPRPRRLKVKYGCPLDFTRLRAQAEACPKPRLKEVYQHVSDEIMNAIAKLEPHAD
ncbi:MAG TPA: lysophospholipid acyltransferase family protein [Verrucomicrobiae bacterium]|nr:lysophospholipid acyltransferase family protein [Verrucomicrobiae bacterium]